MQYKPRTLVQTKTLYDLSNEFKLIGAWWERRKVDFGDCTVFYDHLSLVTDRLYVIDSVHPGEQLPYHATELRTGKKVHLHPGLILKPLLSLVKCEVSLEELMAVREAKAKRIKEANKKRINMRNIPRS